LTEKIAHTSTISFPLEGFLSHLREEGFSVRPEQYHEVNVLLNTIAGEYIFEELGTLLSPIFVSSREEQSAFYEIFEQYFSKITNENKPSKRIKGASAKTKIEKVVTPKKAWYDNDTLRVFGFGFGLVTYLMLVFWILEEISNYLPASIAQMYEKDPPGFVIIAHVCIAI